MSNLRTIAGQAVEPRAVNMQEAARLLSLSPHTVRAYVANGKIAVTRVGRRILVPMAEVDRIAEHGIPRDSGWRSDR